MGLRLTSKCVNGPPVGNDLPVENRGARSSSYNNEEK